MTKKFLERFADVEADQSFSGGRVDPSKVFIVGLDVPPDFAPGLYQKERCDPSLVDSALVDAIDSRLGYRGPSITLARVTGKLAGEEGTLTCVVDGRQRVMATRLVNERRAATGGVPIRVPFVESADAPEVLTATQAAANLHRRDDSVYTKAQNAYHMRLAGASDEEIRKTFGVDQQTLERTWLPLFESGSKELQAAVKAGNIPIATAAKVAKSGASRETQTKALEAVRADGGALTGKKGAQNLKSAIEATKPTKAKGAPTKEVKVESKAWNRAMLRAFRDDSAPSVPAENGKTEDPLSKHSNLLHAFLLVLLGDEPSARTMKALGYADEAELVRKWAREFRATSATK